MLRLILLYAFSVIGTVNAIADRYRDCVSASSPKRKIQACTQIIKSMPKKLDDLAIAYNNRAGAFFTKRRYSRSIFDYNKALAIRPNDADILRNRGLVYEKTKARDRAAKDYRAALRINPQLGVARLALKRLTSTPIGATAEPGSVFKDCDQCPIMIVVPAGGFMMRLGDSEASAKPLFKALIAKPFAVGKFEVTFAQWDACFLDNECKHQPDDQGWGRGDRPVINVSWLDITNQFLPWLSRKTGKTYRLLTVAEWQYVARAGTTTTYWWGNKPSRQHANYGSDVCCSGFTHGLDKWLYTSPVGSFKANTFGLHDTNGNVWEWLQNCVEDRYSTNPKNSDAVTLNECEHRVLSGGSWDVTSYYLSSAYRYWLKPNKRQYNVGFRIMRLISN